MVAHYLYSPASSYPFPYARLIDREGHVVHEWTSTAEQVPPERNPPGFLRGWNHVELGPDGSLLAIVPLHGVLKLAPDSSVLWTCLTAAHHDIEVLPSGETWVLSENARYIVHNETPRVILDNEVTVIDTAGRVRERHSLYDILIADEAIAGHIGKAMAARQVVTGIPAAAEPRETLRLLRELPDSPCDIMHCNTLEVLAEHPRGLWNAGDVLLSFRNLNMIAVVDLAARAVRWSWGADALAGQHQPSALPDGQVLVFDNGAGTGRSRLLEIDPGPDFVTWEYTADSFYTELAGGCERLDNGNTLVSEAQAGRAFEVTRVGRIVWEWTIAAPAAQTTRATFYRMAYVRDEVVRNVVG